MANISIYGIKLALLLYIAKRKSLYNNNFHLSIKDKTIVLIIGSHVTTTHNIKVLGIDRPLNPLMLQKISRCTKYMVIKPYYVWKWKLGFFPEIDNFTPE